MEGNSPARLVFTPAAEQDLEDIWIYTSQRWSPRQADSYIDGLEATFQTLLSMPEIARERPEYTPPIRIHPSAHHLIIYRLIGADLVVLRVLSGRQDWQVLFTSD